MLSSQALTAGVLQVHSLAQRSTHAFAQVEALLAQQTQILDQLHESVLTMETKNEGEYLLLEDTKPAGFEAVEQRSGGGAVLRELRKAAANAPATKGGREPEEYGDRTASAHAEWRDRHGAFFVDRIGQGFWELRSEFRAERPGRFHALPATAEAMYVPELRANGDEVRLEVHD
jgi:uncharacterized protein YfaS (alpha-2-macroglobulin family)